MIKRGISYGRNLVILIFSLCLILVPILMVTIIVIQSGITMAARLFGFAGLMYLLMMYVGFYLLTDIINTERVARGKSPLPFKRFQKQLDAIAYASIRDTLGKKYEKK